MLDHIGPRIGWTGTLIDEPVPDVAKPNLEAIQGACNIALSLMEEFPNTSRHKDHRFLDRLANEVSTFVSGLPEPDWEAVHFIANNLSLEDEGVFDMAKRA